MMQHKGLCKLMGLDYKIEYKKGIENKVADALSRQQGQQRSSGAEVAVVTEIVPQWLEEVKSSYEGDPWIQELKEKSKQGEINSKFSNSQGLWKYKGRICLGSNQGWRERIMHEVHDTSLGGHSGILATYKRIKSLFYWPHMKEEIHKFVQSCGNCQQNKNEHLRLPGLLQPLPIPDGAWLSVSIDFITGLPKSEGKEVILVMVDRLTKYAHFAPLKHPFQASDVAQVFLETVYKLHGLPQNIISDRDPIFTSRFWQELMEKLGVQLNLSTSYHPQTDGQTERVNQCIEGYLRCMLFNQPKNWCRWLPLAEYWYNTNFHNSLKTTPFQALYGYPPPQLPMGAPPRAAVASVDEMLKERHKWTLELREQLKKAQARMKRYADEKRSDRKFKIGDWVYLKLQPYRQITVQQRKNQKLSPKYYGPFEVIGKRGEVAYELKLPAGTQIHPVFHVSQLKGRIGRGQAISPNIPLNHPKLNSKEAPEGILGRRFIKRNNSAVPQILVKWEGQEDENASWEDYEVIKEKFPAFILRDKDDFERRGVSGNNLILLGAVETVDPVKQRNRKEEGKKHGGQETGQEMLFNKLSMTDGVSGTGNSNIAFGQQRKKSLTKGPEDRSVN